MNEALNLDGADRGSQSHFATRDGKGKQSSVFHGQGGVRDSHKDELAQYFRLIDAALAPVLADEQAPLVLAGVDYLLPIYRKVCRYPHLAAVELPGNFEHLGVKQIHGQVWPLIKPVLGEARQLAADKYRRLAGTGKTTDDIRQALPAAFAGQIETLFVPAQRQVWGVCDPQGQVADVHGEQQRGDDDLLDTAAVQTLLHRGSVYVVDKQEIPSTEELAAVYRFA
jgi:hypothetical protein